MKRRTGWLWGRAEQCWGACLLDLPTDPQTAGNESLGAVQAQ